MTRLAALLFSLLALSAFAQTDPKVIDAAKKEGEVSVYTSLIAEDLAALSQAFEKKYGIKVKGWRAGSEKVLQRALTEARANRQEADVIETNGPELEALYREKTLQPLKSAHLPDLMPQAIRPHGQWVGTRINLFVQSYNTTPREEGGSAEELRRPHQSALEGTPGHRGRGRGLVRDDREGAWRGARPCDLPRDRAHERLLGAQGPHAAGRASSPRAKCPSRSPPTATAPRR